RVLLHQYPHGIGVDHHAADDLARTGSNLYLRTWRAALQGLAFAGSHKAAAARLSTHHLPALDRVRVAQCAGLYRPAGTYALAGNVTDRLAGVEDDVVGQAQDVAFACAQDVQRDDVARLDIAVGDIVVALNT